MPQDIYRDWSAGYITSLRADELPPNATPDAQDAALLYVAGGRCVVGKRLGGELQNLDPVLDTTQTDPDEIRSQAVLRYFGLSGYTLYHFLTTKTGDILRFDPSDGTHSVLESAALTADAPRPVWAFAQNIAFLANGFEQKKIVIIGGQPTVQRVGIERPSAPIVAAGMGSNMTGSYDIALTYYNQNTNHESSLSDFTSVSVTSEGIDVSLPTAGLDDQITHIRIHIRKPSLGPDFYQAAEVAIGTATYTLDLSDNDINALLTLSPDVAENDPPPASVRGFVAHASRLFAWDRNYIYYSRIDKPESFDPDYREPINPDDGQEITAVHRVSDDVLVIFKTNSMYGIFGNDPNSWDVRVIDSAVGCAGPHAVATHEGNTAFISPALGPMFWVAGAPPVQIGTALIADQVTQEALNTTTLKDAIVVTQAQQQKFLYILPTSGSSRNNLILPFNYRLKVWESRWQPFDVASVVEGEDVSGKRYLYIGTYDGRIIKWWTSTLDGVRSNDGSSTFFTLEGDVESGTPTTIVDSSATFDEHLVGAAIYIHTPDHTVFERRTITAVDPTSGEITFTPATSFDFSAQDTANPYHYVIGAPHFVWQTKVEDNGIPFHRKRYMFLYLAGACDQGTTDVTVDFFLDGSPLTISRSFLVTILGSGGVFDFSAFDEAVFGDQAVTLKRIRAGISGRSYSLRVRQWEPGRQFILTQLGCDSKIRLTRY